MSAAVLGVADEAPERERVPAEGHVRVAESWKAEKFAREQLRALVRRVFFTAASPAVNQVVFTAVDTETGIAEICMGIASTLANETTADVALVRAHDSDTSAITQVDQGAPLRQVGNQIRRNLWMVPAAGTCAEGDAASLHAYLSEIRSEFEYSIIEAPPAGESNDATALSQCADGIVLVLSAQHTRRASARKIKEGLDQARVHVLGAVLSDREFPIPERLYRRL